MYKPSQKFSATFTRPADTTAYAVGDLVANNTTAGSVTLLSWVLPQGGIWLRKITLTKSDVDLVNASFRLWLTTDSAVTFTNGDNGALAISGSTLAIADIFGPFDIAPDFSLTGAGDIGSATFDEGLHLLANTPTQNSLCTVYGFLEARGAYTPGNAEVFTLYLRGEPA